MTIVGCVTYLMQHCLLTSALVVQVALEELLDSFPQVQLSLRVGFWLPTKHHSSPYCCMKPRRAVRHVRDLQEVSGFRICDHLKILFAVTSQVCSSLLCKESTVPVVVVFRNSKKEVAGGTLDGNQRRPVLPQGRVW